MSRWKTRLRPMAIGIMLATASEPAAIAAVNTAQIVASAISPGCISWRVSGICYWLFCTQFGCTIRTSVKVSHFIPDAVVSTYMVPGGNPWAEMSLVSQGAGGLENIVTSGLTGVTAGGGNAADIKDPGRRKSNIKFKYADAIGHPAATLIGGQIPGYSCDSAATPLMPYFLSTLDAAAWRTGVPESLYPEALIPGQRELGRTASGNMWGNIYPRSGFIQHTDDDKASAVVAQRVADIITRSGQLHVYQSLTGTRRDGYWPPEPVKENTTNHKWQRLSPQMNSSCAIFPDGDWMAAENGTAAYTLWQPYSCCQRRGQRLLSTTDF